MSDSLIDKIARAVLYEGYILYPYRPSVKTQQRWTFGGIYPQSFSEAQHGTDPCSMQQQCLITYTASTQVRLEVRFLHLVDRSIEKTPTLEKVSSLEVDGYNYQSWQEAIERSVELRFSLPELLRDRTAGIDRGLEFSFEGDRSIEMLGEGPSPLGRLVRDRQKILGAIEIDAQNLANGIARLSIRVINKTGTPIEPELSRDAALMRAFASTHLVLTATDGDFISLTDPPAHFAQFASECQNVNCWPVLVGECGQTDTLLVSPIILPDYPQIAAESPGDLFDGCEIDEILTLRIMTLTDEEKRQAAAIDPLAADMIARTQTLAREQLMSLHGSMRTMNAIVPEAQHG